MSRFPELALALDDCRRLAESPRRSVSTRPSGPRGYASAIELRVRAGDQAAIRDLRDRVRAALRQLLTVTPADRDQYGALIRELTGDGSSRGLLDTLEEIEASLHEQGALSSAARRLIARRWGSPEWRSVRALVEHLC